MPHNLPKAPVEVIPPPDRGGGSESATDEQQGRGPYPMLEGRRRLQSVGGGSSGGRAV